MKPAKPPSRSPRRRYPEELKRQAVQMLLDGHSAASIAENLGIRSVNLIYRWKAQHLHDESASGSDLQRQLQQLQEQLRRVEQERDVLKKALAIFSRST